MNINFPIAGIKNSSKFNSLIYFVCSFVSLVYLSQAYRIILKTSDSLLLLRVTEDYVLIGLLITAVMLKGNLKINNLK